MPGAYRYCFVRFDPFPASGNFYSVLMTFVNSLDPDKARRNVGPDLDPSSLMR